jgi:hypothetical protein
MYRSTGAPTSDANPHEVKILIENAERIKLRVLPTMTLRALRLKVCKTAKCSASNTAIALWLQMRDGACVALESDRDSQDLAWLGLESGSNIIFTQRDK